MSYRIALPLLLSASAAQADVPDVVADIAPVHSLVAKVMGDLGEPTLLVDGSSDPHAVQLRPSQARALGNADLVVWVGPELAPWLERALDGISGGHTMALIDLPTTKTREMDAPHAHGEDAGHDDHGDEDHDDHGHADHDDHGHDDHGDDHEHDEHADHDDHGHDDHGKEDDHAEHTAHDHAEEDGHAHHGTDPHAWLSPDNARAWVTAIAEELAELDPDNAETYAANAARAQADISEADARIVATLAPHQAAEIVTFHDAFGYFADHYGIEIIGSVRPSDASAPSAAALSALKQTVDDHGVACLFAEPAYDPALLETIGEGIDLRTGTIDPLGRDLELGAGFYTTLIETIGGEIADCIGGDQG